MRLFTAIELPDVILEETEKLTLGLPGVRWTEPHTRHITVKFIGDTETAQADRITEMLGTVDCTGLLPFRLSLKSVGVFRSNSGLILWAGVSESPALTELYKKTEAVLSAAGIKKEKRSYHPHVTLARVKSLSEARLHTWLENYRNFTGSEFTAEQFVLFSSILRPDGAVHTPIAEFPEIQ